MFGGTNLLLLHNFLGGSAVVEAISPVEVAPSPRFVKRRTRSGPYRLAGVRSRMTGAWMPRLTRDLSHYGATATMQGATCGMVAGVLAWQVDGATDYVDFGHALNQRNLSQFSWSAWMYRSASNQKVQVSRVETDAVGGFNRTELDWWDDGLLYGYMARDNGETFDIRVANTATGWHHFALTFDGAGSPASDRAKLYFDGVRQSVTVIESSATQTHNSTTAKLLFGAQDLTGPYYSGALGSLEIFDRELSTRDLWWLSRRPGIIHERVRKHYLMSTELADPTLYHVRIRGTSAKRLKIYGPSERRMNVT